MATYQSLITQSMYDKQLDSGKGTLLHLCNDVIEQEVGVIKQKGFVYKGFLFFSFLFPGFMWNYNLQVKEVIVSYFILMEQGKATIKVE